MAELILASTSPVRSRLLTQLGIPFRVVEPEVVEPDLRSLPPLRLVRAAAEVKARAVAAGHPGETVLAADTVICLRRSLFGKPPSVDAARSTLKTLRARTHSVFTAVHVVFAEGGCGRAVSRTLVTMRDYSDSEIEAYLATGEPMGKAGAYAIQGAGRSLIGGVHGPIDNVMGLPLRLVREVLEAPLTGRRPRVC